MAETSTVGAELGHATAKQCSPTTLEDDVAGFACIPRGKRVERTEMNCGDGEGGEDCITLDGCGFGEMEECCSGMLKGR